MNVQSVLKIFVNPSNVESTSLIRKQIIKNVKLSELKFRPDLVSDTFVPKNINKLIPILPDSKIKIPRKTKLELNKIIKEIQPDSAETAVFLDYTTGKEICRTKTQLGTTACMLDPKDSIMLSEYANANKVIIIHNHPTEATLSSLDLSMFAGHNIHTMGYVSKSGGQGYIQRTKDILPEERLDFQLKMMQLVDSESKIACKLRIENKFNLKNFKKLDNWREQYFFPELNKQYGIKYERKTNGYNLEHLNEASKEQNGLSLEIAKREAEKGLDGMPDAVRKMILETIPEQFEKIKTAKWSDLWKNPFSENITP